MINEKSCGAFVLNGKKVLIVQQKKSGNYGFPKGHVEPNETEEETAIREVKEETGVDIEIISNKKYSISYMQNENINKEVVYYLAKAMNKKSQEQQEKEISNIVWVEIEDVEKILSFENIKALWLEAKNDLQNK